LAKRRNIQLPSSVHDACVLTLAASWVVGQWYTLNSLLSVLVKGTRHLIFYTLKSVGEALGEQPHLTGGSKRKPGGKTGSSHQSGNDRRRGSGMPVRSSGLQHSSGRERPKLQIAPDRNQQFACQSNNTNFVQALAALAKATLVPTTEFAVGLVAQPTPGDLNRHSADMSVPDFANPQFMVFFTALVRHGGQSSQSPNFTPVAEGTPREELHHIQPGSIDANASQV